MHKGYVARLLMLTCSVAAILRAPAEAQTQDAGVDEPPSEVSPSDAGVAPQTPTAAGPGADAGLDEVEASKAADAAVEAPLDVSDETSKRITLNAAIGLALREHPRTSAARHQASAAEELIGVAKAGYYPRVDVWLQAVRGTMNGSLTVFHSASGMPRVGGSTPPGVDARDSLNNFMAAATVHQLLYDFGRTRGEVEVQRALREGAKMHEKVVEQDVIFNVTSSYYEVLAKKEGVLVAEDGVQLTRRVFELARTGELAGLRPPSESARAEADVASAELLQIRARAELDVARAGFSNALGDPNARFEPAGDVPEEEVPNTEAQAIAAALRNRPEPRALDYEREALGQRLRSAGAGHYPRLDALAGVNSRGQFLNGGQEEFQVNNWNVGVVLHVPVFQGMRVTHQTRALEAELRALESSQQAVRQAVVLEVKEALAQLRSADEAVRAASKGVNATKVALDTIVGRYRSGLANIIEITDAQTSYISSISAALRASYARRLSRARLLRAMGTLGDKPG